MPTIRLPAFSSLFLARTALLSRVFSTSASSSASGSASSTTQKQTRNLTHSLDPKVDISLSGTACRDKANYSKRHFNRKGTIRITSTRRPKDFPDDNRYNFRVGLIVERMPVVMAPPLPWEYEEEQWAQRVALAKRTPDIPDLDPDEGWDEVRKSSNFMKDELAPVITPDDHANNLQSTDRSLNEPLYLIVKRARKSHQWTLPTCDYPLSSTKQMSVTSFENFFEDISKKDIHIHQIGNYPLAYHKYHYTYDYINERAEPKIGAKLFIFKAVYVQGVANLITKRYTDYAWVKKHQLQDYIEDKELIHVLRDALICDHDPAEHRRKVESGKYVVGDQSQFTDSFFYPREA